MAHTPCINRSWHAMLCLTPRGMKREAASAGASMWSIIA
ncbi:hypothetical protein [Primorskyibacter flagellatus]